METLKELYLSLCIEYTMENDSETVHNETVVTTLCTIINVFPVLEGKPTEQNGCRDAGILNRELAEGDPSMSK